jgi:hypothetical protein
VRVECLVSDTNLEGDGIVGDFLLGSLRGSGMKCNADVSPQRNEVKIPMRMKRRSQRALPSEIQTELSEVKL